jgi:hypothetical protein
MKKSLHQNLIRYYTTDSQGDNIKEYIGLSRKEFELYIDKLLQFDMNRINYGVIWQLDHIVHLYTYLIYQ